jgi:oligoendopeptidase F
MFAEFEKLIHAVEERGDALTLAVFKSEYHKLLEIYFAENFVLDPELDLECLRIPHFYHAFYVYQYATGISAAVALSQRVLSGEPGNVDAYLNFLRSGGSRFPLETLRTAGVDMATPAPIESTLRLFERRLIELEELLL